MVVVLNTDVMIFSEHSTCYWADFINSERVGLAVSNICVPLNVMAPKSMLVVSVLLFKVRKQINVFPTISN